MHYNMTGKEDHLECTRSGERTGQPKEKKGENRIEKEKYPSYISALVIDNASNQYGSRRMDTTTCGS